VGRMLPPAAPVLAYLASCHPGLTFPAQLSSPLPLPPLAMAAALDFIQRCIKVGRSRLSLSKPR